VRKVIGAGRQDLVKQFLGESFLLSLLGVAIAVPLLIMFLPYFNQITQADIHLTFLYDYRLWLILGSLVMLTGLIAGSYPAFYLSAFQAMKVIKGNFSNHISASGIRRFLVVFQFALSIILIAGIIIIYSQLNYIKNKDLGFDKNQKIVFSFHTDETIGQMQGFMKDIRQLSEVNTVSRAETFPGQPVLYDLHLFLSGGNIAKAPDASLIQSDENFVKATGIKLVSGRDFRTLDSGKVIINETLAKSLGLRLDRAPGTTVYSELGDGSHLSLEIAGVMKDYNFSSLHEEIKPLFLMYNPNQGSEIIVSTNSNHYETLLGKMEALWHQDLPAVPFEYVFLDQEVQKQYETEITLSNIINSFTLMAIFISSLGLFGLAAFRAEQRRKEIGIRKVLGANVAGIVQLLSKDFLKLVGIAFILATPISWWAMNKWLQAFVYRIPISWWMFALAGGMAVIVAIFTVTFQAIKAAIANPVRSLRSE
jgi:putative ABC transport system permease protein